MRCRTVGDVKRALAEFPDEMLIIGNGADSGGYDVCRNRYVDIQKVGYVLNPVRYEENPRTNWSYADDGFKAYCDAPEELPGESVYFDSSEDAPAWAPRK